MAPTVGISTYLQLCHTHCEGQKSKLRGLIFCHKSCRALHNKIEPTQLLNLSHIEDRHVLEYWSSEQSTLFYLSSTSFLS